MVAKKKYAALGRGLDALISTDDVHVDGGSTVGEIEVALIRANPNQPRREFDEEALTELAESIRQIGVIQPITLRGMNDGTYEIIAGERRWRAAQRAGLKTVPAYIRTVDDEQMMQMALVENIQREDLNAIEVAMAYQNLMDTFNLTQEKLAERVGKNRATVANFLRLLKLPAQVQLALQNHIVEQGHARALLGLKQASQQVKLFREICDKGYNVRQVEERVKVLNGEIVKPAKGKRPKKEILPAAYQPLKKHLSEFFGTPVKMSCLRGKGEITIPFKNEEQLERIIVLFDKMK